MKTKYLKYIVSFAILFTINGVSAAVSGDEFQEFIINQEKNYNKLIEIDEKLLDTEAKVTELNDLTTELKYNFNILGEEKKLEKNTFNHLLETLKSREYSVNEKEKLYNFTIEELLRWSKIFGSAIFIMLLILGFIKRGEIKDAKKEMREEANYLHNRLNEFIEEKERKIETEIDLLNSKNKIALNEIRDKAEDEILPKSIGSIEERITTVENKLDKLEYEDEERERKRKILKETLTKIKEKQNNKKTENTSDNPFKQND